MSKPKAFKKKETGQNLTFLRTLLLATAIMAPLEKISVIIPLKPGEESWRDLIADLTPLPSQSEVILVGPEPGKEMMQRREMDLGTLQLRFHCAPLGRARQLNEGARLATGSYLWFLHADSRVPPQTISTLLERLAARTSQALLYFDLRFLSDGPALTRLNAWGANLRSHLLGLPFGDQGLFMEREIFLRLNGFDESCDIGEDHHLIWRCGRLRVPVLPVGAHIFTSARKYRELGWFNVTLKHLLLTAAQALPEALIAWRRRPN